jgi:hypothetical protein
MYNYYIGCSLTKTYDKNRSESVLQILFYHVFESNLDEEESLFILETHQGGCALTGEEWER